MSYTALYRKFRPAEFEDVKGQEHIVTTLQNQIKANKEAAGAATAGTAGAGTAGGVSTLDPSSFDWTAWVFVGAVVVVCGVVAFVLVRKALAHRERAKIFKAVAGEIE